MAIVGLSDAAQTAFTFGQSGRACEPSASAWLPCAYAKSDLVMLRRSAASRAAWSKDILGRWASADMEPRGGRDKRLPVLWMRDKMRSSSSCCLGDGWKPCWRSDGASESFQAEDLPWLLHTGELMLEPPPQQLDLDTGRESTTLSGVEKHSCKTAGQSGRASTKQQQRVDNRECDLRARARAQRVGGRGCGPESKSRMNQSISASSRLI